MAEFSKESDANGPKQLFEGSAGKGSLPDAEKTSAPKKEFGNKGKK